MCQNGYKLFAQTKDNVRHSKAMCALMLEETASVSVLTVIVREHTFSTRGHLYRFDALNTITCLDTISPYVLHGTRSDLAGNERKVFQTVIPVFDAISDKVVPRFAASDTQKKRFTRFGQDFLPHDLAVQHNAVIILYKEQVTAGTDVQPRGISERCDNLFELCHRSILNKLSARGINAKSIVLKERVGHSRVSLCQVLGKFIAQQTALSHKRLQAYCRICGKWMQRTV